ncbi:MAG: DUF4197 family protein, partial [Bacteroidetes bacterium]|nr:DUF4197 family protein [Bacteroidota bacterium]
MKKTLLLLALFVLSVSVVQAQFGKVLEKAKKTVESAKTGDLSSDEIGNGLKEALNQGVGEAADFLSAKDGYFKSAYKILLPEEAQKVVSKLKVVPGFANLEADLVE